MSTAAKKNLIKQIFELMYVVEAHCYVVDKSVKIAVDSSDLLLLSPLPRIKSKYSISCENETE